MATVERRAPPTPTAALPTPFPRLLAPAAALLTFLVVGCGADEVPLDDATRTTPAPTATATETVTVTPTAVTPTPDGASRRVVIVAPQQPITLEPGQQREFTVPAEFRGDQVATFGLAWTPCAVVPATAPGELTFPDTDDDDTADRMAESDTGAARLALVNGEQYENVDQQWPTTVQPDGDTLTFTLRSDEADCAVPVVFIDEDGDEQLDLDQDDTPDELYGVGQVEWRS